LSNVPKNTSKTCPNRLRTAQKAARSRQPYVKQRFIAAKNRGQPRRRQ